VGSAGAVTAGAADATLGARSFSRLGRGIQRHPWWPVIAWVVLLVIALPLLSRIGTVTTNSAANVPSSAPSAQAAAEIARLFPNQTAGSASYVILVGPEVTGPQGQATTLAVARSLANDRNLTYLDGVSSLYSAYGGYLGGLTELANGVIGAATTGPDAVPAAVNETAELEWGPPAAFLASWQALLAAHPGTAPSEWNAPAERSTAANLSAGPAQSVLTAFYGGTGAPGFNGTGNCAANPSTAVSCADSSARAGIAPILPTLFPNATDRAAGSVVLGSLATENFTAWPNVRNASADVIALSAGLAPSWLSDVWSHWPASGPTTAAARSWAQGIANSTAVASWPLPVPISIYSQFVSADGTATLVFIAFTQDDGYTTSTGATPIYSDVVEINRVVPATLSTVPGGTAYQFYQTGGAALDQNEATDLSSSLGIVLPLTLLVLVIITIAYFRAPLAPLVTFGSLGLALGLATAGVVVVGTLVGKVDVTSIELVITFVLGVGTDYSIFLVARYREELTNGKSPAEALLLSTTWAGQSVAISGGTAILATLALTVSGVALLSQWGSVLALAILITVLVALTLVPALLFLIGPKIFWPEVGERATKAAAARRDRLAREDTYFYRAGRTSQRHPKAIILVILLVSVPLLYVALNVPESYDFYAQLPGGHPATVGLSELNDRFGSGFAFPMDVLVTFSQPLVVGTTANALEFHDLSSLTGVIASTGGVASVRSPVGADGATLGAWLNWSSSPPAVQSMLSGTLSPYLGSDGRTVWLTVVPTASGLSVQAVDLLNSLRSELSGFSDSHPEVTSIAYGGGAPTTADVQAQTTVALYRMALIVFLGLIAVLFVALRSAILPPMAVATITLSIGWSWAVTYLVLDLGFGIPLFYFVPVILFVLILGLGIDYNIFVLTRVREERLRGRSSTEAAVEAIGRTGGIITAAAVILASAFAILISANFLLLKAIGFAVAAAIVLDAMVVRTYLVPASLHLLGDRVWGRAPPPTKTTSPEPSGSAASEPEPATS
jgi:RND superfamily putative drug exporter